MGGIVSAKSTLLVFSASMISSRLAKVMEMERSGYFARKAVTIGSRYPEVLNINEIVFSDLPSISSIFAIRAST